jgi:hypothetical protein
MNRYPHFVLSMILAGACLPAFNGQAAPASFADRLQACTFRHAFADIPRLADLPPAVRLAVWAHGGPMAEKGEAFNATDVITLDSSTKRPTQPHTRFLRAGQWQDLVFVWYEAGGIALFHRLAIYRLDGDNGARLVGDLYDGGHDICALTDTALDAAKPQP